MGRARGQLRLLAALTATAAAGFAVPAGQAAKPKLPKPKVSLLTTKQEGALRRESIKISVEAKRGETVRVEAGFLIDGYPEDYFFRLGPERKRLRAGKAIVSLALSARQREVLDFAAQTCRPASLDLEAKVGKRTGTAKGRLKKPADCRRG